MQGVPFARPLPFLWLLFLRSEQQACMHAVSVCGGRANEVLQGLWRQLNCGAPVIGDGNISPARQHHPFPKFPRHRFGDLHRDAVKDDGVAYFGCSFGRWRAPVLANGEQVSHPILHAVDVSWGGGAPAYLSVGVLQPLAQPFTSSSPSHRGRYRYQGVPWVGAQDRNARGRVALPLYGALALRVVSGGVSFFMACPCAQAFQVHARTFHQKRQRVPQRDGVVSFCR